MSYYNDCHNIISRLVYYVHCYVASSLGGDVTCCLEDIPPSHILYETLLCIPLFPPPHPHKPHTPHPTHPIRIPTSLWEGDIYMLSMTFIIGGRYNVKPQNLTNSRPTFLYFQPVYGRYLV